MVLIWNSEVREIILSTNSGQIGIMPNHAPLLTALDMGVSKIRSGGQWSAMASMGGFAMIDNNRVTILVNEAEVPPPGCHCSITSFSTKLLLKDLSFTGNGISLNYKRLRLQFPSGLID
ncbi:hypothetical protein KP509_1Z017800 [Ceratopteris richardii]|nr:hypothetical protein KP509_1Z017800 [Ceratopteris richardii]